MIGKGSFCELFIGRDLSEFSPESSLFCAIKIQTSNIESSVVKYEAEILKALSGLETVPHYIDHGRHEGAEYLIMELLGGEDMSKLRERARRQCGVRLVPLPITIHCMKQMLLCLKDVHSRGYVHRDVKPANFVRKSKDSTTFCVIDFGLTKQYIDNNGKLIPNRENVEFRGTTIYASPFTLEKEEQCPRDDLYGLAFVLCDFLCGTLPWAEASRDKNKPEVARLKKYYMSEPTLLPQFVCSTANAEAKKASNGEEKTGTLKWPFDSTYDPCPGVIAPLTELFSYLGNLRYDDATPDYSKIDSILDTINAAYLQSRARSGAVQEINDPADLRYTCHGSFSWTKGQNILPTHSMKMTGDDVDVHEAVRVKSGHLQAYFEAALGGNAAGNGNGNGNAMSQSSDDRAVVSGAVEPERMSSKLTNPIAHLVRTPHRLRKFWLALHNDLLSIENTSVIHSTTISNILGMVRSADYFLGHVPLGATYRPRSSSSSSSSESEKTRSVPPNGADKGSGSGDASARFAALLEEKQSHQDWKDFMTLQSALHALVKLEKRVKRRYSTGGPGPPLKKPRQGNVSFSALQAAAEGETGER